MASIVMMEGEVTKWEAAESQGDELCAGEFILFMNTPSTLCVLLHRVL